MAQVAGQAVKAGLRSRQAVASPLAAPSEDRRVALVAVFALVALLSLLYLTQTSLLASEGYQIGVLEAARDNWKVRNDQLGLQIAEARSLSNVEREAKRLGMGPPERVIYLHAPPTPAGQPGRPATMDEVRVDGSATRQHGP